MGGKFIQRSRQAWTTPLKYYITPFSKAAKATTELRMGMGCKHSEDTQILIWPHQFRKRVCTQVICMYLLWEWKGCVQKFTFHVWIPSCRKSPHKTFSAHCRCKAAKLISQCSDPKNLKLDALSGVYAESSRISLNRLSYKVSSVTCSSFKCHVHHHDFHVSRTPRGSAQDQIQQILLKWRTFYFNLRLVKEKLGGPHGAHSRHDVVQSKSCIDFAFFPFCFDHNWRKRPGDG